MSKAFAALLRGNDDVHRFFPEGGEFSDKAFMSSSYDSTKAFNKKVKLNIETTNPQAKVGDISVYGDTEAEVLFGSGKKFDVVSKDKKPDGTWDIKLREKD